jgi:8-oxo-dGTP diphosphatase
MSELVEDIVRRGAVAVIVREGRLLVIRRSRWVVAPLRLCFPGGAIESAETEQAAVVREIQEELGAEIRPIRRLWESITPWHVHLAWWLSELSPDSRLTPNPSEVDSIQWFTPQDLADQPDLLESNHAFLQTLESGQIDLTP